jgi:hypothetical protein
LFKYGSGLYYRRVEFINLSKGHKDEWREVRIAELMHKMRKGDGTEKGMGKGKAAVEVATQRSAYSGAQIREFFAPSVYSLPLLQKRWCFGLSNKNWQNANVLRLPSSFLDAGPFISNRVARKCSGRNENNKEISVSDFLVPPLPPTCPGRNIIHIKDLAIGRGADGAGNLGCEL